MTPPKIVGLIGYAGAGKDEAGRVLCDEFGYVRRAFADPLKVLARKLGWDGVKDGKGRRFLQLLGEAMRELDPLVWVKKVEDSFRWFDLKGSSPRVVITDVRYRNEAEWITARGGVLVRIVRPGVTAANSHASEHDLAAFPTAYHVDNGGTLAEFRLDVGHIARALETRWSDEPARTPLHLPGERRTVYVAGPMTKYAETGWNYDTFNRVAGELRGLGHHVVNPAENFDGRTDLAREVYMRRNLTDLMGCDTVVLLPGWRDSSGARCEEAVARQLNLDVVEYSGAKS